MAASGRTSARFGWKPEASAAGAAGAQRVGAELAPPFAARVPPGPTSRHQYLIRYASYLESLQSQA